MSLRKTLEYTGVNASTYNITLTFTGSDTDKYRIVAVNGVDLGSPVLCSAGPYMMSWAHAANPGTITFEPVEDVAGGTATYNMTATATFDDDGDSLIAATPAVHGQEVWTPDAYGNDQPAYLVGGATISGGVLLTDDGQGALVTVSGNLTSAAQDWTIQGEHKRTGATVGDRVFEWSEDIDNLVQLYVDGGGRIDGWIGVGGVFTTINGSAVAPVGSFIDWALSYDDSTTTLRLMVGGAAVVTSVVDLSALTSMQFMSIGYGQSDPKGSGQAGEARNVRVLIGQTATSQPASDNPLPLVPQSADEHNFQWDLSFARTLVDTDADEDIDAWDYDEEQANDTDFLKADSDTGGVQDSADPDPLDDWVESAWAEDWFAASSDSYVLGMRLTDDTDPAMRSENDNTPAGQGVNTDAETTRNADALTFPDTALQHYLEWTAAAVSNTFVQVPAGLSGDVSTTMFFHARRTNTAGDLEIWSSRTTVPDTTRARILHRAGEIALFDGTTARGAVSYTNVPDQALAIATIFDGDGLSFFVTEDGQRFANVGTAAGNVDQTEIERPAYRHNTTSNPAIASRLWGFAASADQLQIHQLVESYALASGYNTETFTDTSGNNRKAYVCGDASISATPAFDTGSHAFAVIPYEAALFPTDIQIELDYTPNNTTETAIRQLVLTSLRDFPDGTIDLRVLTNGTVNLDYRSAGTWKTAAFDAPLVGGTEVNIRAELVAGTWTLYRDNVAQVQTASVTHADPGYDVVIGAGHYANQSNPALGEIRNFEIRSGATALVTLPMTGF